MGASAARAFAAMCPRPREGWPRMRVAMTVAAQRHDVGRIERARWFGQHWSLVVGDEVGRTDSAAGARACLAGGMAQLAPCGRGVDGMVDVVLATARAGARSAAGEAGTQPSAHAVHLARVRHPCAKLAAHANAPVRQCATPLGGARRACVSVAPPCATRAPWVVAHGRRVMSSSPCERVEGFLADLPVLVGGE